MTATAEPARATRPWHLWLVGIVAVLWNAYGAYDYVMTNTQGEAYLRSAGMTDAQITYFNAMPDWMTAVWAIGVWGGVLGSLLLLLRSKWSLHVFLASLAAVVVSVIYTFGLSEGAEAYGMGAAMYAVIAAIAAFLAWYAWTMTKRGVLR